MKILRKTFFRSSNFRSVFFILIVVGIFFWKVIFKGMIPFPGDFVVGIYYPWLDYKWGYQVGVPVKNPILADVPSFIYPMQTYAASLLKSGQWPLWNPYILSGSPLLANFQSAPFSPTIIFYYLFSAQQAWTLQIMTAHFLAALFTYILLRSWKLTPIAAIFGGVVFSFSGFNMIWSQWNGHVLTAAFLPLMIFFADRYFEQPRRLLGIGLAVSLAMQIYAGYPQVVLYSAITFGIVALLHFSFSQKYFLRLFALAIFLLLGLGLSAMQLLPSKELLSLSQWRADQSLASWTFLPLAKTITFIAPDYFGNHATNNYWGPQDYTSNIGFIGACALIMALIGVVSLRKKGVWIAIILAIVALVLSYNTPLSMGLWVNNTFGMGSSSAHRALVLFNLGISILGGYGVNSFSDKQMKVSYKLLFLPFTLLAVFIWYTFKYPSHQSVAFRNLVLPTTFLIGACFCVFLAKFKSFKKLGIALIMILTLLELFRFGWKFNSFSSPSLVFPDTPVTTFLKEQKKPFRISNGNTMPVNFQIAYGLETLGGYETMRPFALSQLIATINSNDPSADPSGRYGIIDNDTSPIMDLANTKYYLTLKVNEKGSPDPTGHIPAKYDAGRFKVAFEDKTTVVLESIKTRPRAFMVYDWAIINNQQEILKTLIDPTFPLFSKILLEEDPGIEKSVDQVKAINYEVYNGQSSQLNVQTPNAGILFISDIWYPGWHAYVDSKEVPILKADYTFRGVAVPSGTHQVRFTYMPDSFVNGRRLTMIFGILLIILAFPSFLKLGKSRIL